MKKIFITILLCCTLILSGCESSNYVGEKVEENLTDNVYVVNFESLDGLLVKKLTNSYNQDVSLYCMGSIESGTVNVYYKDFTNDKELLFTINAGEEFNDVKGYISNGASVTIYVEVDDAYNGNIEVGLITY